MVKKEVSKPVVAAVKKVEKVEAVKEAAKAETKAVAAEKKPAETRKAAPAKKAAAPRKAPARKAETPVKETVFVQYAGKEFETAKLVEAAKKDFEKRTGIKAADIRTVELYVKPEENAAYYVVNGKAEEDYKIEL